MDEFSGLWGNIDKSGSLIIVISRFVALIRKSLFVFIFLSFARNFFFY